MFLLSDSAKERTSFERVRWGTGDRLREAAEWSAGRYAIRNVWHTAWLHIFSVPCRRHQQKMSWDLNLNWNSWIMVLEKGRGGSHETVTVQAWKRSWGFHLPRRPVPRQHLICQTSPGRNVPLRIFIQVVSRLYMNSQLKNMSLVAKAWKTKHFTHHSCAVWGQVPKGRRVYWQWMEKRNRAKTGVANRQVWILFILRGLMFLYWGGILCVTLLSCIISFAFSPLSKILFVELNHFSCWVGEF